MLICGANMKSGKGSWRLTIDIQMYNAENARKGEIFLTMIYEPLI